MLHELGQHAARHVFVRALIKLADTFFHPVRDRYLTVRIPKRQQRRQPLLRVDTQPFLPCQQHSACPKQWILHPPTTAGLLALHPAPNFVEGTVCSLHAVERVNNLLYPWQGDGEHCRIRVRHIQCPVPDSSFPRCWLRMHPPRNVSEVFRGEELKDLVVADISNRGDILPATMSAALHERRFV